MPTPKLLSDGTVSVETPPTIPVPLFVLKAVKADRAASKSDFQIVDTMQNIGADSPKRYGFTGSPAHNRWTGADVAALRTANGIS